MADLVQISKLQYPSEKGPGLSRAPVEPKLGAEKVVPPGSDPFHADGRLQAVLTPESKAEHRTYWLENVRLH